VEFKYSAVVWDQLSRGTKGSDGREMGRHDIRESGNVGWVVGTVKRRLLLSEHGQPPGSGGDPFLKWIRPAGAFERSSVDPMQNQTNQVPGSQSEPLSVGDVCRSRCRRGV
jgi:hypothetical protein